MGVDAAIEAYRDACRSFARGEPAAVKALYARSDDVTLANPFGYCVCGWDEVEAALDFASSRFRDGDVPAFTRIATYEGPDLVTIFELERWEAKVSGRDEMTPFELRVSTTFRRDGGDWKVVSRHADPITSERPDGPIQDTAA